LTEELFSAGTSVFPGLPIRRPSSASSKKSAASG
jgi:hypothetical protein